MKFKMLQTLAVLLTVTLVLFGCQSQKLEESSTGNDETRISVVASFLPMYEFTKKVAGDRADVQLMVSEGQDAHHYEPSAQDVAVVNKADVFVYSSDEMEFWTKSLFKTIENDNLIIVRAADIDNQDNHVHIDEKHKENDHEDHSQTQAGEGVSIVGLADHYHTGDVVTLNANILEEKNYEHWNWFVRSDSTQDWEAVPDQETERFEYKTSGDSFEVKAVLYDNDHNVYAESSAISVKIDNHEGKDPHIWLDPVLAQDQVLAIRNALMEADPNGKEIYEENAEAFVKELMALDNDYQAALKDAENRTFVVQHQAFGHLADRYHLEQIAIGGLSTELEPSPSRIAEISELVHKHNVPVIYYQQGASSAIAQTVATETGTETAVLYDLEVLSEELLANDLGYLEAMRLNLEALQASIH